MRSGIPAQSPENRKKNQNIVLAEENNSNYDKFKQKLTLLTPPKT